MATTEHWSEALMNPTRISEEEAVLDAVGLLARAKAGEHFLIESKGVLIELTPCPKLSLRIADKSINKAQDQ